MSEANVVEQAWEVFEKVQRENGSPGPDEVSFVGGFMACFGVLTGKVDVGLDQNAPLTEAFDLVHRSLLRVASIVEENKRKQMQ